MSGDSGTSGAGTPRWERFYDDSLREKFKQFETDRHFLETHQSKWLGQYPDMFVAVYREQLVGAAPTAAELAKQLAAKGVPAGRSYWRFLSSNPIDLVVPG